MGDRVWLQLNKERLQGLGNNVKALGYGPLERLENVGDNSYRMILLPYNLIYSVINLENLNFYEPSTLNHEREHILPFVEDLTQVP